MLTVFDIYSFYFYFNVYLSYVAHVNYIFKRIWYGNAIFRWPWVTLEGRISNHSSASTSQALAVSPVKH